MKIEIKLNDNDLRGIVAEHCKKNFKIDPRNIDIKFAEPGGKNIYYVVIEGEYYPEP